MSSLLIDDRRDEKSPGVGPLDRIARTYADGIAALEEQRWDVLYLDHDLGDFSGPNGRELTGYDVMCWLEAHPEHLPGMIIVVTSNASGRPRINQVINKLYGRTWR